MKNIILQKLQKESETLENQIKLHYTGLENALKNLKLICPYFDYRLELSCAVEMLNAVLRTEFDPARREAISKTIDNFNKMIARYDSAMTSIETIISNDSVII